MNFLCDLLPRVVEYEKAESFAEEKVEDARKEFEEKLQAVRQEFAIYKKSGEQRQAQERRRVSSLITAVQNVDGGYEGLQARWTHGMSSDA